MGKFGNLQAVLWDMDGVLLDSRMAHLKSLNEVLTHYDFNVKEEDFRPTFGMTTGQGLRLVSGQRFTDAQIAEICNLKNVQFRQVIAREAVFLEGVEKWLRVFQQAGVRQALASCSPWDNIDTILDALKARPYFDAVISGEECASKPDPAVFLRAAAQLEVEPAACLVIEDSIPGVQAAAAAGMKCLAVATTYPLEKLPHADLLLPTLAELIPEMLTTLF